MNSRILEICFFLSCLLGPTALMAASSGLIPFGPGVLYFFLCSMVSMILLPSAIDAMDKREEQKFMAELLKKRA